MAGAAVGVVIAFALPGLAEIASIEPSSGRVYRGESTSAVLAVTGDRLTCLSATASHPTITVTLDVNTACGIGDRGVAMDIRTSELTPVGEHNVAIWEIDALEAVLGERVWNLSVLASATTTSTSSTTSTTSTTPPKSTTTAPARTTTPTATTPTTTATTTTTPMTTTTTTTTMSSVPESTTTTGPPATGIAGGPGEPPTAVAETPSDGGGVYSSATQSLRSALASHLPPAVADIVVSPFLVADVIARAVLASGSALFPIALMGAAVGWAAWNLIPMTEHFDANQGSTSYLTKVVPVGSGSNPGASGKAQPGRSVAPEGGDA